MELSKKLSKNMKTLRGSKSQAAFSKEIGIAKATVNSIETQRASIRLDTLEVICLHLGIPPQSLLSDEMDCMESGMLEYLLGRTEWYLKLSPEDQQAYIQWLRHTADLFERLIGQNKERKERSLWTTTPFCSSLGLHQIIRATTRCSPPLRSSRPTRRR